MASSKANRQVFISSLLDFLKKWDFAGVDIDWEWPGSDTRGGNPAIDKQNQVDLMKELRAALGSRGLSIVLPAQYAYLQHLDPKALEGYVDAFNVLAHDLHGVSISSPILVVYCLSKSLNLMLTISSPGMPQSLTSVPMQSLTPV